MSADLKQQLTTLLKSIASIATQQKDHGALDEIDKINDLLAQTSQSIEDGMTTRVKIAALLMSLLAEFPKLDVTPTHKLIRDYLAELCLRPLSKPKSMQFAAVKDDAGKPVKMDEPTKAEGSPHQHKSSR